MSLGNAQQTLRDAMMALGPDARYLASPKVLPDDFQASAICGAAIRLHDLILANEPSLAANAIRAMYLAVAATAQK